MQFINIKDHKTGDTVKALNFGGPKCYKVSNRYIWAPKGGTSLTINENNIVLEPLGLVVNNPNIWTIVSHQNIGTANWRVTVKNLATNEEKTNVYPFNLNGNVYELECQPGTWVIASCGGYKIESSWNEQNTTTCLRLKGTNETIGFLTALADRQDYTLYSGRFANGNVVAFAVTLIDFPIGLYFSESCGYNVSVASEIKNCSNTGRFIYTRFFGWSNEAYILVAELANYQGWGTRISLSTTFYAVKQTAIKVKFKLVDPYKPIIHVYLNDPRVVGIAADSSGGGEVIFVNEDFTE